MVAGRGDACTPETPSVGVPGGVAPVDAGAGSVATPRSTTRLTPEISPLGAAMALSRMQSVIRAASSALGRDAGHGARVVSARRGAFCHGCGAAAFQPGLRKRARIFFS